MSDGKARCSWTLESDELMCRYHDEEWGVPEHDDRALYEKLVLDGAQAGLSWSTILNKREGYRRAFEGFEIERVAGYGEQEVERLLQDEGIVRNRQKVHSAIRNAQAVLEIQDEFGSFDAYLWDWVDGEPIRNAWTALDAVPAETELSKKLSKEMKKRGFNFVGPTILYAYMQAIGMVNDHLVTCFRYDQV